MLQDQKRVPANGIIILLLVLANVIAIKDGYTDDEKWYGVLVLTVPLLLLAILSIRQKRHAKYKKQTVAYGMQADPKVPGSETQWPFAKKALRPKKRSPIITDYHALFH